MLICFTTPCHNMIIILRQLPYSGYKSNIIVHENTPNQANVPSALIHLFICFFCSQQIQPWKKKSCCRQNKEKIPDSFLLFNGLKVHFFTGRTSNNYSSLQQVWALIYQHLKGGAVVQSKERKKGKRKKEMSKVRTRCGSKKW